MAEFTEERFTEAVEKIKEAFADGFQLRDLATLIGVVVSVAELFELTGEEKRAVAIRLGERVIRETDTPWLPDSLTDPLMIRFLPTVIDLVVDATKGKIAVNGGEPQAILRSIFGGPAPAPEPEPEGGASKDEGEPEDPPTED